MVCAEVEFAPGLGFALNFHVLDCTLGCILGLPFLKQVNPCIDWVAREVSVGGCKLRVVG